MLLFFIQAFCPNSAVNRKKKHKNTKKSTVTWFCPSISLTTTKLFNLYENIFVVPPLPFPLLFFKRFIVKQLTQKKSVFLWKLISNVLAILGASSLLFLEHPFPVIFLYYIFDSFNLLFILI